MANRTDDFNRSNSTSLGTPSDAGSAWVDVNGRFDVDTNMAKSVSAADTLTTLEASVADVAIQATTAIAVSNVGLSARCSGAGNAIVASFGSGSGVAGGCAIYRFQSGSYTLLTSDSAGNIAIGDTVKLEVNGTGLAFYVNGGLRISTTSTFNQTTTAHGLFSYSDGGSSFDDFSITELGGGGGTTPKGVLGKPLYGPMRRVVFQ